MTRDRDDSKLQAQLAGHARSPTDTNSGHCVGSVAKVAKVASVATHSVSCYFEPIDLLTHSHKIALPSSSGKHPFWLAQNMDPNTVGGQLDSGSGVLAIREKN